MNQSSKLLKYLEGMRIVELLQADERAIFPLFGLSFDLTAETVLAQQEEFKRNLLKGIILELLDYNVDEVSDPHNYTGTGKLQYELYKYGDEKAIDVLYAIFGEKLNGTFRELYDDHILVKTKKIANNARENAELLHDTDPEIFENNFPNLINRYDWRELESEYQKYKKRHTVTMEWLQEKQERLLQKVLELDIMHYADEPSTQAIEDSDYPYHRRFLSHKFKDNPDYEEAYTKFMQFATRKDGLIIPKLGEYCKYIAMYINKFRPEQKEALFGIIKKLELIHKDMVMFNPELGKYLGLTNDEGIEGSKYFGIYINLLKMFEEPWFKEFRSDKKYSLKWMEQFLDNLLRSEYRDEIADEWKNKSLFVKGCIIGCMKEAGIISGSDLSIATAIINGDEKDNKTFAIYMGKGKKRSFCKWICEYLRQ